MAGAGGPAADVNVGTDILAAVARPTDAVRALRREIKAAERELAKLVLAGNTAAAATIGGRIRTMEGQQAAIREVIKRQRDMETRNKRALDAGMLFKSVIGAQAIKNILNGELDARGLVGLAIMSERTIARAARQLGGVKFSNFARGLIRAVPFIGEGVNSVVEGFGEIDRRIKNREQVMEMVKGGKMSWELGRLHNEEFLRWDTRLRDPGGLVNNVSSAADRLAGMSKDQRIRALSKARYKHTEFNIDKMLAGRARKRVQFDWKQFESQYSTLLSEASNQGLIVDEAKRREIIEQILTRQVENTADREKLAKAIYDSVNKFRADDKDNSPKTIKDKFKLDEERRREAVEAKRWIIPARLEF